MTYQLYEGRAGSLELTEVEVQVLDEHSLIHKASATEYELAQGVTAQDVLDVLNAWEAA
jgi:hypothetical protein